MLPSSNPLARSNCARSISLKPWGRRGFIRRRSRSGCRTTSVSAKARWWSRSLSGCTPPAAQVKEFRLETIFRYGSDVRPLITDRFAFTEAVAAFDYACHMKPTSVKIQIELA